MTMSEDPAADVPAFLVSEAGFRVLTDAMPQMVWSTRPDGYHDYYNAQWYAFTGMTPGSTDGEEWNGMFHADDQEAAWAKWRHSLATGEPYEIEYRLRRHDGMYRWTIGRALPVYEDGKIVRWIGTCTDIHGPKLASEQNEILNRELSHRIKNIFSVVAGLIEMTGRAHTELRPVFRSLSQRVVSLGRAHNFARSHSEQSRPTLPNDRLHGILVELMAPYQSEDGRRVSIRSDDIELDDRGATPIALIIHEMATNAAKYGALSVDGATVTITSSLHGEDVVIQWIEEGGPPISAEPSTLGFGDRLISMSAERQLDGKVEREWNEAGLRARITIPKKNLYRYNS